MSISYVSGATAGSNTTTLNVAWPAGGSAPASGDIALLFWSSSSGNTVTDPAGWTLEGSQNSAQGSLRFRVLSKVCAGTETGNIGLVMNGTNRQSAVLVIYRGVAAASYVNAITFRQEGASAVTSHAHPAVTPTSASCSIISAFGERQSTGSTAVTEPSGYTERGDTLSLANGSGGTITEVADDGLATSHSSGSPVTPGNTVANVASSGVVAASIALLAASSAITVNVGQASETDTGAAITPSHTVAVGQASETDTAGTITPSITVNVGQATSTETAGTITPSKTVPVGQAVSTETALDITPSKTVNVGQAVETDSATDVTPSRTVQVGIATETDTAGAIAPPGVTVVPVEQAAEVDTANAITPSKTVTVGMAIETDTASAIAPAHTVSVGMAQEASSAGTITPSHTVAVGRATETDSAGQITPQMPVPTVDITIRIGPPERSWSAGPPARAWSAGPPEL